MENIDLVLWLLLYPLVTDISDYITAKRRQLEGKTFFENDSYGKVAVLQLILYVLVSIILYKF